MSNVTCKIEPRISLYVQQCRICGKPDMDSLLDEDYMMVSPISYICKECAEGLKKLLYGEENKMEWNDFQPNFDDSCYEETNIKCPKCAALLKRYTRTVLTTYPAKYRYDCPECGWSGVK